MIVIFSYLNHMNRIAVLSLLLLCLTIGSAQAQIPYFSFKDLSGKAFTRDQLKLDQPVMIMLFDPYCDHCEKQASWIAAAAGRMKHVQFVFVTLETDTEAVRSFKNRFYGNANLPALHFLQDTEYKFEQYFGYTQDAINIYLYKPGVKGLKYFGSEQPVDVLLQYL
jgi:thiol-disulfide isomerase/thioredoxin